MGHRRTRRAPARETGAGVSDAGDLAGRVVLEALRLDLENEADVRAQATRALDVGAGGFIIFGGEAKQVTRLVTDLRAAAPHPLWIGSDLERGPGQQFAGLPTLPPPAGLAAHADPTAAANAAGRATGRAARAVGVDLVFAPVLDLDIEPRNPIVGTRAFSGDPEVVARLGAAWIAGCQGEGVLACAKHFPGHGRTTTDSHAEIPRVEASTEQLAADLLPFRRLAPLVAAMLTAHVSYPALGSTSPATMAPQVLTDLLRKDLGFTGLAVTDAMNMSGFLDAGSDPGRGAVAALLAGCDLLLYPEDIVGTVHTLRVEAESDAHVLRRLEEASARSAAVRARFADVRGTEAGPDDGIDVDDLALGCMTWTRDSPGWLRSGRPLHVVPVWDDRPLAGRPPLGAVFTEALRDTGCPATLHDTAAAPPPGSLVVILVASTPQAWKGTAGLTPPAVAAVEAARSVASESLIVGLGHRRLVVDLGGGLCAWGSEPAMERAAARALTAATGHGH
jgi:beta-glucosidase